MLVETSFCGAKHLDRQESRDDAGVGVGDVGAGDRLLRTPSRPTGLKPVSYHREPRSR